jgi:glycosyltransferase involved in cell wall biosynthesis
MEGPEVSVILPVYNRSEYLGPAIASVLDQSFAGWELVIVDDGSDDPATLSILAGLGDPRVRVVRQDHTGSPAAARNAAIAEARGTYLAFVDSDDLWLPDKLAVQLAAMRADPALGWSYGPIERIDGHGGPVDSNRYKPWLPHDTDMARKLLRSEAVVATPTVMMRRDLAQALGGFDAGLEHGEDYDLWIRAAWQSPVAVVGAVLVRVRVHPGSFSRDPVRARRNWMKLYDKLSRLAPDAADRAYARELKAVNALRLGALLARQPAGRGEAWQLLRRHGLAVLLHPGQWGYVARACIALLLGPAKASREPPLSSPVAANRR